MNKAILLLLALLLIAGGATILAIGCYVAFVYLLKLQFPVWPAFLTN